MASVANINKILGRMADIEHQKVEKTFFGLIYAGFGTGKTTLAAGIAQAIKGNGQILFLDSAQGAAALDNMPKLKRSMQRIQVLDPRELPVIANALKGKKGAWSDFTVVILDEVDAWFEKILHNYVREKYGITESEDLPEIEGKDYNTPTAAMLSVLNTFLSVDNLQVILVAHEQERGKEPRTFIAPSLPPKLMRGINERVHVVTRLEAVISKDGYVRTLQVNPSKQVVAKSRIGGLPVKVDFTDMPKIIREWVSSDQMAKDLTSKAPDPDPVEDSEIDVEEPEEGDHVEEDEEEAVEVE